MQLKYNACNEFSYSPSKWCFDMLPLQNESELQPGGLTYVLLQNILDSSKCSLTSSQIDRVFAIDLDVLIAVSLKSRLIITYHSYQNYHYKVYTCPFPEQWLDIACVASENKAGYGNPYNYSLFILTEKNRLLNLEMDWGTKAFEQNYCVTIDSKHQYTKLLLREPCRGDNSGESSLYLWDPKRKILQQFEISLESQKRQQNDTLSGFKSGVATPIKLTEFKIRNPRLVGYEVPVSGYDLTLCIDSQKNSILCADSKNHILFECSRIGSNSEILCGCGEAGCAEEGTPSQEAHISSPCAPLVFRPQDYVEKERFTHSSKNILGAEQAGRPRIILLCDAGNQAVRKIWQFPDNPQAQDLANFDRISTLIRENAGRLDMTSMLKLPCSNPKAIYSNPYGLLTVTTEHYAYVIASYSVIPEQNIVKSGVSEST